MKWGGGGGPEGGGPGCCTEVHGVDGVQGGGGTRGIHNTIHNTTQTRHVYGGGGVGPAGHRPSDMLLKD